MIVLENGGVLLEPAKTIPEFIDSLIDDMDDKIDDYTGSLKRSDDLIDIVEYNARIKELRAWRNSLKELKAEHEEG